MMKVMDFPSGVRTQHVFGWVSIIWFTSVVSIAASQGVELHTVSQVAAQCGNTTTLTCDASSAGRLDIKSFYWLAKNKSMCQYKGSNPDTEVPCNSTDEPHRHTITLTLLNVMPADQGEYLCKLRSTVGAKSAPAVVTIQDCLESSGSFISEAHAKCWFSGVYPRGTIRWSQGHINLKDPAGTQVEVDQYGRFNVSSTIDVREGNVSQPYNCSLWIPSARKYLSTQQLHVVGKQIKNGSPVSKLQWICITVEIMMVTFLNR